MRTIVLTTAVVLGLFASPHADAAVTLGLASVEEATIQFEGTGSQSTVTFTNGVNNHGFAITTVDGVVGGSPTGLFGTISGAFTYLVSNITSSGLSQAAPLTGSGVLTIGPVGGDQLTANIVGIDIFSLGGVGGVNGLTNAVNLSNVVYNGTNAALLAVKNEAVAAGGIATISYSFTSSTSLTDLAASGSTTMTTYSGTLTTEPVTAVPEPATMGMAVTGVALLSLGYLRQRRRLLA